MKEQGREGFNTYIHPKPVPHLKLVQSCYDEATTPIYVVPRVPNRTSLDLLDPFLLSTTHAFYMLMFQCRDAHTLSEKTTKKFPDGTARHGDVWKMCSDKYASVDLRTIAGKPHDPTKKPTKAAMDILFTSAELLALRRMADRYSSTHQNEDPYGRADWKTIQDTAVGKLMDGQEQNYRDIDDAIHAELDRIMTFLSLNPTQGQQLSALEKVTLEYGPMLRKVLGALRFTGLARRAEPFRAIRDGYEASKRAWAVNDGKFLKSARFNYKENAEKERMKREALMPYRKRSRAATDEEDSGVDVSLPAPPPKKRQTVSSAPVLPLAPVPDSAPYWQTQPAPAPQPDALWSEFAPSASSSTGSEEGPRYPDQLPAWESAPLPPIGKSWPPSLPEVPSEPFGLGDVGSFANSEPWTDFEFSKPWIPSSPPSRNSSTSASTFTSRSTSPASSKSSVASSFTPAPRFPLDPRLSAFPVDPYQSPSEPRLLPSYNALSDFLNVPQHGRRHGMEHGLGVDKHAETKARPSAMSHDELLKKCGPAPAWLQEPPTARQPQVSAVTPSQTPMSRPNWPEQAPPMTAVSSLPRLDTRSHPHGNAHASLVPTPSLQDWEHRYDQYAWQNLKRDGSAITSERQVVSKPAERLMNYQFRQPLAQQHGNTVMQGYMAPSSARRMNVPAPVGANRYLQGSGRGMNAPAPRGQLSVPSQNNVPSQQLQLPSSSSEVHGMNRDYSQTAYTPQQAPQSQIFGMPQMLEFDYSDPIIRCAIATKEAARLAEAKILAEIDEQKKQSELDEAKKQAELDEAKEQAEAADLEKSRLWYEEYLRTQAQQWGKVKTTSRCY
ncbi:hypothetical protein BJ508DRAFT_313006 [Ascobolus immersus RN42]|uniref:Uncharacterized protein n=1 Tax=Ascobolus immersus RN42 TaxID=1160509 RepID=A0A3N4HKB7_ASCIM|nr:hypothetical protein BJ508DRAFT_313006 [Ascobolus immersus RN42]